MCITEVNLADVCMILLVPLPPLTVSSSMGNDDHILEECVQGCSLLLAHGQVYAVG